MQYSVTVNNARLDAIETTIGASPIMKIFTGSPPANCATADSGTLLATLNLPSDWMAAASGASKSMSGTWEDSSADATGNPGHFRIYDSTGTTCHIQGTAGKTMDKDLVLSTTTVGSGLSFAVISFTINAGNT